MLLSFTDQRKNVQCDTFQCGENTFTFHSFMSFLRWEYSVSETELIGPEVKHIQSWYENSLSLFIPLIIPLRVITYQCGPSQLSMMVLLFYFFLFGNPLIYLSSNHLTSDDSLDMKNHPSHTRKSQECNKTCQFSYTHEEGHTEEGQVRAPSRETYD